MKHLTYLILLALLGAAIAAFSTPTQSPCKAPTAEPVPGFLAHDGATHDPGSCGWNGDAQADGTCKVTLAFPGYRAVRCKTLTDVVECVWTPKQEAR